ncbi:DNA/RNA non-specific endonuclease [soil metagenome]
MVNRNEVDFRRVEVMKAAARRWKSKTPEVTSTARRLARGGPAAATSPDRMAKFVAREALKSTLRFRGIGFERIIGPTMDLEDVPPTTEAKEAGRPIARIVELLSNNRVGEGFATGFTLAPGLLMTNWHVFAQPGDATGCGGQFGYERNEAGLLDSGVVFELDPQSFFLSDEELDIALVGIKKAVAIGSGALSDYGSVRLIPAQGKILVGHPISVIQHPDGRHKHWAVRQNKLVLEPKGDDLFISYTTDTLGGSSGSPAFNFDWELVAIHHSGVPRVENGKILTRSGAEWKPGMPDTDIDWVANEGARVSKIHGYLKQIELQDATQQSLLAKLVSESTDPVLSGEIGLTSEANSVPVAGQRDHFMNITVNGTANFYLGKEENRATGNSWFNPPDTATPGIIAVEKKLKFDADYAHRPGYVSTFLPGFEVPRPTAPLEEVVKVGTKTRVLKYHHYSLVMHEDRRLAMWTAANVDYSPAKRWRNRKDFGGETWKPDPRIPIESQIEDLEFYEPAAKFDRGHIVRRDDVAWGQTKKGEEFGNSDSYHWTNCTPQHEGFNRDAFDYQGLWGQLENHIAKEAGFLKNVLILFAGPVLDSNDPSRDFGSGIEVQVPMVFWKIVVAVEEQNQEHTLRAYGFVLDQTDAIEEYGWEARFRVGKFTEQQVSLLNITERSRVAFDQILHNADPLANAPHESRGRRLNTLADLRLR